MADQISARRAATNNFLLTVNAFLVTLYGVASSFQPGAWLLAVAAAGFVVSLTWCALILSYKNLNSAKYAVMRYDQKLWMAI